VSGVKAKVDSARKLTVGDGVGNLTVDGTVYARPSAAANPFNLQRIAFQDDNFTELTPLTTATIAITDLRIANGTANATQLSIYQYEGASCSSSATYVKGIIGSYYAPAGQTLIESLSTPVVVKPSVPGNSFCLATYASGSTGSGMWLQVNGYTVSGTFAATSARADAKAGPADGPPSRNP
jgi:hypothetical protein